MGYVTQGSKYGTWVPAYTGFSSDPSNVVAEWSLNGATCTVFVNSTAGTSNTTAKTITLPFNADSSAIQTFLIQVVNNGTTQTGLLVTRVGSNIADLYATAAAGAWTGSGTCNMRPCFTYKIEV